MILSQHTSGELKITQAPLAHARAHTYTHQAQVHARRLNPYYDGRKQVHGKSLFFPVAIFPDWLKGLKNVPRRQLLIGFPLWPETKQLQRPKEHGKKICLSSSVIRRIKTQNTGGRQRRGSSGGRGQAGWEGEGSEQTLSLHQRTQKEQQKQQTPGHGRSPGRACLMLWCWIYH